MHTDDGRPVDAGRAVRRAGRARPPTCRPAWPSSGLGELGEADLWITVTQPDLVRLTITGGGPLRGTVLPLVPLGAMAADRRPDGGSGRGASGWPRCCRPGSARRGVTAYGGFEVAVRGFGPAGRRAWPGGWPGRSWPGTGWAAPGPSELSAARLPPGYPVDEAPGQVILDRQHTRLALSWAAA